MASSTEQLLKRFVPASSSIPHHILKRLELFVGSARRLFVLTGAGVSTESGIRDYRSEGVGLYASSHHRPVQHADFIKSTEARQRYWARNAMAWPRFSTFKPNSAHKLCASLEHQGHLHWTVTQNVDGLHIKAGSRRITELHGTMHAVVCLDCKTVISREELQSKIGELNGGWEPTVEGYAPDADSIIADDAVKAFNVPACESCGGVLKPNVTFFGDSVPRSVVYDVNQKVAESDALLVMGSSCQTYSAYRHLLHAQRLELPIGILNIGHTRADHIAFLKVDGSCSEAANWLLSRMKMKP